MCRGPSALQFIIITEWVRPHWKHLTRVGLAKIPKKAALAIWPRIAAACKSAPGKAVVGWKSGFGAKEWWEWPNLRQRVLMLKMWIRKRERVQFCLFSTAVSPGAMSSCQNHSRWLFLHQPISGAKSFEPTHWCNQEDVEQQPKDKIRWDDMSKINWISQWQSTLIVLRSCASPCSSPYHLSALLFHFFLLVHRCVGLFLTLMKTDRSHSFCFCQVVPRCEPFL